MRKYYQVYFRIILCEAINNYENWEKCVDFWRKRRCLRKKLYICSVKTTKQTSV